MKQRIRAAGLCALILLCLPGLGAFSQVRPEPEYIVWTWDVRPKHVDPKLPNVLLEGDSLSRNYFPEVQRRLAGKANVYLMANSLCLGDPRLPEEIVMFAKAEHVRFQVVHFNNGMHGPDYTEAKYTSGFSAYLAALRSIAPGARFIWATTTPVKADLNSGLTNARITARNAIAHTYVRGMAVDDQHALMEKHQDLYQDNIHFTAEGANISGAQAAEMILQALETLSPPKSN